jgi:site-specific recombinase XerD
VPVVREPSAERLVAAWLDELESARTRDAYGRDVAAFVTWCDANGHDLLRVGLAEVSGFRDECEAEGFRSATIARRLSALASFFNHALVAQVVDMNPVTAVTRPPVRTEAVRVGLEELDAVALLAAAGEIGPKVVVLVALLLVEGLRLAEALALDVEHLHRSGRRMQATVTRRGAAQSVALDRRTSAAIAKYLAGRTHGPLLIGESPTNDGGTRLTRFGADFLLKRAAAEAGLEPLSANTLRRTHIAASHRDGVSVEKIADRVGHANPRDTRRYLP